MFKELKKRKIKQFEIFMIQDEDAFYIQHHEYYKANHNRTKNYFQTRAMSRKAANSHFNYSLKIMIKDKKTMKKAIKPDTCPTCGHKLSKPKTITEKGSAASRENGKLGGRPKKQVEK